MLIVMRARSTREEQERVVRFVADQGLTAHPFPGQDRPVIGVTGDTSRLDPAIFQNMPGVEQAIAVARPYRLVDRETRPGETVIRLGAVEIGGGALSIIAGPCAVESEEQVLRTARMLKDAGADLLRGGAFKPRTSPYSFQGLGIEGLRYLARAREETSLPIVTEAVDEPSLELVEEYADVIQIGARSMQNFSLLRRAGKSRRPVFLKRGIAASLEDLLLSAEYVLNEGNEQVVLCERGIRTFSGHSRFTLDLGVVPAAREISHLPIFVDPSHGTGSRERVPAMARAAVAAGAHGVMLEVHPTPEKARSDGGQALLPDRFEGLVAELRAIHAILARKVDAVP